VCQIEPETAAGSSSLLGELGVQVSGGQVFERALSDRRHGFRGFPPLDGSFADVEDGCQVFLGEIDGIRRRANSVPVMGRQYVGSEWNSIGPDADLYTKRR
jgi:hypothetical protein